MTCADVICLMVSCGRLERDLQVRVVTRNAEGAVVETRTAPVVYTYLLGHEAVVMIDADDLAKAVPVKV